MVHLRLHRQPRLPLELQVEHFAKLEATKISERTKAGLERARRQGKKLGQPSKVDQWHPVLVKMQGEGVSLRGMARETGLSVNTVKKYLAES